MKNPIVQLVILFLAIGQGSMAQNMPKMQGAYSLSSQIGNNGTRDSLMKTNQFKIYTDRYMMYASPNATDSMATYGIGTYSTANGKVVENVFFSTTDGNRKDTIELAVTKVPTGYKQVIDFSNETEGKFILTEEYKNVSKAVTTPLDGAWKQTKTMFIPKSGTPITDNNPTQYKMYQSGCFIWADTYTDVETNKPMSRFGYGTFKMVGPNKVEETNTNSTFFNTLVGKPVLLQVAFTGKDNYSQTIVYPNGDRSVEVYERLK